MLKKTVTTVYTLELTKEEVQVLLDLLFSTGGSPDQSVRKHTDSVAAKIIGSEDFKRGPEPDEIRGRWQTIDIKARSIPEGL